VLISRFLVLVREIRVIRGSTDLPMAPARHSDETPMTHGVRQQSAVRSHRDRLEHCCFRNSNLSGIFYFEFLILSLVLVLLCAQSGCYLPPTTHTATESRYVVPQIDGGQAVAPVVRQQDPDDAGLFSLPSLSAIKDSKFFNGVKKLAGMDLNEPLARQQFQEAEELFRQGQYAEAAAKYKSAAKHWPDSPLEEDAMFMRAECLFFSDKYPAASDTYAELLKKYENSRHLDKVVSRQFSIAHYWHELQQARPKMSISPNLLDKTRPRFDTNGNSLAAFESVRLNDPTGPLADDSVMATANAYFLNDRYEDADYYYGLLRDEYPKSEHLIEAYVLGLKAKLRKYGGPQYDATPLKEAEQLIEVMLEQFPDELGDEKARVIQAGRAVRAQLAERDWHMGEFYHKQKYYRAASIYYENLVNEYSDTQFAQMAKDRLAETSGLPPEPPQSFAWLDNLFPGSKKRR
jgi:outer membrane protein assembly factor BamD (BamD/ComL family)